MASKLIDLTGQTFGRLRVVRRARLKSRNTSWKCLCQCGKHTVAISGNLLNGRHRSCGCGRKGLTAFRARKRIEQAGYVFVKSPKHPRANPHTGRVREHILVMEAKLKRCLLPGEEVHHKNGIRSDNRTRNLELWTKSHPAGSRVKDQVQWALSVLQMYAPKRLKTAARTLKSTRNTTGAILQG